MKNSQDYQIVRANKENIGWLAELFKANGSGNTDVAKLRRKYNTAYTGHSYFAHFAVSPEGRPAAFFCLFPSFLNIDGRKVLAGQSADIITHPDHQRRGLFGTLGKATEALAKAHGMMHLFAFPNANSFPGFLRSLGWQHLNDFQVHTGTVQGFAWFRLFRKLKQEALYNMIFNWQLSRLRLSPDDVRLANVKDRSGQWRDAGYYTYKSWNGSYWIAFRGFAFWVRREADLLLVGDLRRLNQSNSTATLNDVLTQLCRRVGLSGWRAEVTPGSLLCTWMQNVGKTEQGVHIVYTNLDDPSIILPLEFSGGDTDVF